MQARPSSSAGVGGRIVGPLVLVTAFAVGSTIAWGVTLSEVIRFSAFELLAVITPGVLAWVALSGEPPLTLRSLSIGAALGHAILIGAFALTAALGIRDWLPLAIAVVAVIAGAVAAGRRRAHRPDARLPSGWLWAVAGLSVLFTAYLAVGLFTQTPLPDDVGRVSYFQDYVFHLSLAAEALHHWPIGEPKVSGEPLPYQTFFYMAIAGTAEVTGVELAVLLFRLVPLALLLLVCAQAAWAGRELTGRVWAGPIAVALLIGVGELDPSTSREFVFYNTVFFSLHTSPTFLLGLVLFIPALVLAAEISGAGLRETSAGPGHWIALALLLLACAGTKASILPVLVGGLLIYAVVRWLLGSGVNWPVLGMVGLAGAIFLATYVAFYEGGSGGLRLDPPGSIQEMAPIVLAETHVDGIPVVEQLFWVASTPVGIAGFCVAPALGAIWLLRMRLRALPPVYILLLSVFASSLVPFLLLSHPGGSQNFFTYYGYVGLVIAAAGGLSLLLEAWRTRADSDRRMEVRYLLGATAMVLGAAVVVGRSPGLSELPRYVLWFVLPILFVAAGILLVARNRKPAWLAAGLAAAALTYGVLDTPLDVSTPVVERLSDGDPPYPTAGRGLTRGLDEGLRWIRSSTPDDAVLAVSNYWVDEERRNAFYSYYSALAERRVFLEGWGYTIKSADLGPKRVYDQRENPYPRRFAENEAVFRRADPAALRRLVDQGVDYLVADLSNSNVSPQLGRLGRRVFSNQEVAIYAVGAAAGEDDPVGSRQAQSTAASSVTSVSSPTS